MPLSSIRSLAKTRLLSVNSICGNRLKDLDCNPLELTDIQIAVEPLLL